MWHGHLTKKRVTVWPKYKHTLLTKRWWKFGVKMHCNRFILSPITISYQMRGRHLLETDHLWAILKTNQFSYLWSWSETVYTATLVNVLCKKYKDVILPEHLDSILQCVFIFYKLLEQEEKPSPGWKFASQTHSFSVTKSLYKGWQQQKYGQIYI